MATPLSNPIVKIEYEEEYMSTEESREINMSNSSRIMENKNNKEAQKNQNAEEELENSHYFLNMGKQIGRHITEMTYFWPGPFNQIKNRFLELQDGAFFLRWANSLKSFMKLCIRTRLPSVGAEKGIYKHSLLLNDNGFFCLSHSDIAFQTIDELIQHYMSFKEDLPHKLVLIPIISYMGSDSVEKSIHYDNRNTVHARSRKTEIQESPLKARFTLKEPEDGYKCLENPLFEVSVPRSSRSSSITNFSRPRTSQYKYVRKTQPRMNVAPNVVRNQYITISIEDEMPDFGEPFYHEPLETTYVSDRRRISVKSLKIENHEYDFTCVRPESRWTPKGVVHVFRCHNCSSYVNKFKGEYRIHDKLRRSIPYIVTLAGRIITNPDEPCGKTHMCTNGTENDALIKTEPLDMPDDNQLDVFEINSTKEEKLQDDELSNERKSKKHKLNRAEMVEKMAYVRAKRKCVSIQKQDKISQNKEKCSNNNEDLENSCEVTGTSDPGQNMHEESNTSEKLSISLSKNSTSVNGLPETTETSNLNKIDEKKYYGIVKKHMEKKLRTKRRTNKLTLDQDYSKNTEKEAENSKNELENAEKQPEIEFDNLSARIKTELCNDAWENDKEVENDNENTMRTSMETNGLEESQENLINVQLETYDISTRIFVKEEPTETDQIFEVLEPETNENVSKCSASLLLQSQSQHQQTNNDIKMEIMADLFQANEDYDQNLDMENVDIDSFLLNKLLFDELRPNWAMMLYKSNVHDNDRDRKVACSSRAVLEHKYLFWIREKNYKFERSIAFCQACYDFKKSFDHKFDSDRRLSDKTLLRYIPSIVVDAKSRRIVTDPDFPGVVNHVCIPKSQNQVLNDPFLEQRIFGNDTPFYNLSIPSTSGLQNDFSSNENPSYSINARVKFGMIYFDPFTDENGTLVYYMSRKFTAYNYEFLREDVEPIPTEAGPAFVFMCKNCKELNTTDNLSNVPRIYVVNGHEVIHSNPDSPINSEHICVPVYLNSTIKTRSIRQATKAENRSHATKCISTASTYHTPLISPKPRGPLKCGRKPKISLEAEENLKIEGNQFLLQLQEKFSNMIIEHDYKIRHLKIEPGFEEAVQYKPNITRRTKKPKNPNSIKKEPESIVIPKIGKLYQSIHSRMLRNAMIKLLQEGRKFSGLKALYNQITRDNPDVDIQKAAIFLKRALKYGLKNGAFKIWRRNKWNTNKCQTDFSTKYGLGSGKVTRKRQSKNDDSDADEEEEELKLEQSKKVTQTNLIEIEKIHGCRHFHGRRQFMLKFRHEKQSRWIPEGMLTGTNKHVEYLLSMDSRNRLNNYLREHGQCGLVFKYSNKAPIIQGRMKMAKINKTKKIGKNKLLKRWRQKRQKKGAKTKVEQEKNLQDIYAIAEQATDDEARLIKLEPPDADQISNSHQIFDI